LDLYLEWNGDLVLAQDGNLQAAVGWDQVRQRIIRRMITNSAQVLPTGVQTPADYFFEPNFGFGLGAMVDGDFTDDFLEQLKSRISQAVFADQDVDATIPPSIRFLRPVPNELQILVGITLLTGEPGQIAIQVMQ
jgi:hypothetical protein